MNPLHTAIKLANTVGSANRLSILIYHEVPLSNDPMRPDTPDADTFRWQMRLLRQHFRPLALHEAVRRLQDGDLPPRSVCVTFDDGYRNNLEVATPILREFDIPATIFIATAFSDGRNMWNDRIIDLAGDPFLTRINLECLGLPPRDLASQQDRLGLVSELLPALKYRDYREREALVDALYRENSAEEAAPRMMSHQELIQLSRSGVTLGAHTVDHPILKALAPAEQRRQIESSKHALENLTGKAVTSFAYPNGKPGKDYDEVAMQMAQEAGFTEAVSTNWGISTPTTNRFQLNRFTPWDKNPLRFHLRLLRTVVGAT
ncbi:MAG: polysaccharide deacetylase family protein [Halioglobus sp.]